MPRHPLLFFADLPQTLAHKGHGRAKPPHLPARDRKTHSARILHAFENAWAQNEATTMDRTTVAIPAKEGIYLEISGAAGHDLVTKSLDSSRDYSLLNVRQRGEGSEKITTATIYIPDDSKRTFIQKIDDYATKLSPKGKPKNAALIDGINEVKVAVLNSFWTDDPVDIPQEHPVWCEIWLRDTEERTAFARFVETSKAIGIVCCPQVCLEFPERTVTLAKINQAGFHKLLIHLSDIAECRLVREPATFFTEISPSEQADWIKDFLRQAQFEPDSQISVCILDTGVKNGHPLLQPILQDKDMHTVDPNWGIHDHNGHGTNMAGVVAYGNLAEALASPLGLNVTHCLESSKILAPQNDLDPMLYGFVTAMGISQAEDAAPNKKRQICMAVTADSPFARRGEPTSWSAAVDALASGANEPDSPKRLILVSAGNTNDNEYHLYPESNLTQSVQDPAQAWNALTIGAFTSFDKPAPALEGWKPLACYGGLAPCSTTSSLWESAWPAKPDVLFEGGNIAIDAAKNCTDDEHLSVLTTSHRHDSLLRYFNGTSAATAEAAWFAAKIQAAYPEAWPETIRALMVHSAEWTPAMLAQFIKSGGKTEFAQLRSICGYGVPSLERAMYCQNNSLVLVAERELQPYVKKEDGGDGMQMHFFELPWPAEALQDLGEQKITMRVTLSYFIEPGPGQRGWKNKYRYASHGLRFDVCGAQETKKEFLGRVQSAMQEEEDGVASPRDTDVNRRWTIGVNGRANGSLHSDFWIDTAVAMASCKYIVVHPVVGWWRERKHLKRMESKARYSLIVSLHTEAQDVDIYTPVKIQIENSIKVPVSIPVLQ